MEVESDVSAPDDLVGDTSQSMPKVVDTRKDQHRIP